MTSATTPNSVRVPVQLATGLVAAVILGAFLTAAGQMGFFNGEDVKASEEIGTWLVLEVLPIALVAGVVGYVGTRLWADDRMTMSALILALVGLATVIVFFLGIYVPLAVGSLILSAESLRRSASRRPQVIVVAAIAIAGFALVAGALLNLFG